MRYGSTRGSAPAISFRESVLSGVAVDGGLYAPAEALPNAFDRAALSGLAFSDVAATALHAFAGDEISLEALQAAARRAYAPFDHPAVAPLRALGGDAFLLELFHGPTLAFKDVAMRYLAALHPWAAQGRGPQTIIGATSGDTGGAAVDAFAGAPSAEVFMLHPAGRISDVQRRIMTANPAANIVNLSVDGSFDDCQRLAKALLRSPRLAARLNLAGVNSVNWTRLAAQVSYYFSACAAFSGSVSFVVPTGNLGDAYAGYLARRLGAPIERITLAVNANDVLKRMIDGGVYAPRASVATAAPSMDIQVASNFERLLFDALGRDPAAAAAFMRDLDETGAAAVPSDALLAIRAIFDAERASDAEAAAAIDAHYRRFGVLIDPHTAVGVVALEKRRAAGALKGPAIVIATAHPAKFPDVVAAATGVVPALPARYADLASRPERSIPAASDLATIEALILEKTLFGR